MTLKSFSWTESVSKFRQGWWIYRLTKKAADRALLLPGPGATASFTPQMSQQGKALMEERNQRMATASSHEEEFQIWKSIRLRALEIDYRLESPNYNPAGES